MGCWLCRPRSRSLDQQQPQGGLSLAEKPAGGGWTLGGSGAFPRASPRRKSALGSWHLLSLPARPRPPVSSRQLIRRPRNAGPCGETEAEHKVMQTGGTLETGPGWGLLSLPSAQQLGPDLWRAWGMIGSHPEMPSSRCPEVGLSLHPVPASDLTPPPGQETQPEAVEAGSLSGLLGASAPPARLLGKDGAEVPAHLPTLSRGSEVASVSWAARLAFRSARRPCGLAASLALRPPRAEPGPQNFTAPVFWVDGAPAPGLSLLARPTALPRSRRRAAPGCLSSLTKGRCRYSSALPSPRLYLFIACAEDQNSLPLNALGSGA